MAAFLCVICRKAAQAFQRQTSINCLNRYKYLPQLYSQEINKKETMAALYYNEKPLQLSLRPSGVYVCFKSSRRLLSAVVKGILCMLKTKAEDATMDLSAHSYQSFLLNTLP